MIVRLLGSGMNGFDGIDAPVSSWTHSIAAHWHGLVAHRQRGRAAPLLIRDRYRLKPSIDVFGSRCSVVTLSVVSLMLSRAGCSRRLLFSSISILSRM